MIKLLNVDVCAIGAGSGGLAVAGKAARMGASTVLIEKGKMGGDCLNYGCVPSKSLLAAGHVAETIRRSGEFGIESSLPTINSTDIFHHVHDTMATLAPNDSAEHFEGFGVKVIQAPAHFVSPQEVEAGDYRITAKHFVIATGCSPAVPLITGLDTVPYYTNETIFYASLIPSNLIIIGGGPTGVEMAQAHRNLGAKVTLFEMSSILSQDDPELVQILRKQLTDGGVILYEGVQITRVVKIENDVLVKFLENGRESCVKGSHILISAGRTANVAGLGLENADISHTTKGITVDARLRTSNKRVFAVGDIAGKHQFAHMAVYHAKIVILNALFRCPVKVAQHAVPRVTYTHPELAQVGMTEEEAKNQLSNVRVLRHAIDHNDRSHIERQTVGLYKIVTTRGGRVVGAGIIGPNAGELIQLWILMTTKRMNVRNITNMIFPYPTFGYINKYVGDSFFTPMIYSKVMKKLVRIFTYFR